MIFDVKVTDASGDDCVVACEIDVAGGGIDWTQLAWVPADISFPIATVSSLPNGANSDTCIQSSTVSDGSGYASSRNYGTMMYTGPAVNCKVTVNCTNIIGTGNTSQIIITCGGPVLNDYVIDPPASRVVTFTIPAKLVPTAINVQCRDTCGSGLGFPWRLDMTSIFENV